MRKLFAQSLQQPVLLAVLMIMLIGMLFFSRAQYKRLEARVDRNSFAICQALNDARDRAFASLATDPKGQAIAVGKINRTMSLLDCAAQGFPEKFDVR